MTRTAVARRTANRNTTVSLIATVLTAALAITLSVTAPDFGSGSIHYANDWQCAVATLPRTLESDWSCGAPNVMTQFLAAN